MSEKLKLNNTYDLTKNITGLEINTGTHQQGKTKPGLYDPALFIGLSKKWGTRPIGMLVSFSYRMDKTFEFVRVLAARLELHS